MAAVMAQPGLAPTARQDVISDILNDYSGLENGDVSPYILSSPALKELPRTPPPPPPQAKEKPLPPVMMKFQLRVDDPPRTPQSQQIETRKDSPSPPTKIVTRSISRSSKPPSLKLQRSAGSTAQVPVSLASSPASDTAVEDNNDDFESSSVPPPLPPRVSSLPQRRRTNSSDRPLPALPPTPPEKSQLRSIATMGNKHSKQFKDEVDEGKNDGEQGGDASNPQSVKRKPLPKLTGTKPVAAFQESRTDARGRKPVAKPATAAQPVPEAPRNSSAKNSPVEVPSLPTPTSPLDELQNSPAVEARAAGEGHRPSMNTLENLPTPEQTSPVEDQHLKSINTMHTRGKSSTGYNLMTGQNTPAAIPALTITPSPTLSPASPPKGFPRYRLNDPAPIPLSIVQKKCIAGHQQFTFSRERQHRTACAVCSSTEPEKVFCAHCFLRLCKPCRDGLAAIPGRDIQELVRRRAENQEEGVVAGEE